MGGIKGEKQKCDVVSWRWLAVHLKMVCAFVCVYVGVFAHDRKIWRRYTISAYFSLQQRMHPPQFFPLFLLSFTWLKLSSSLCPHFCEFFFFFSAAVVSTSSIVEWITDQLELVLYFSTRDRITKTVSDVWAQRDSSCNIIGIMLFVH